MTVDPQRTTHLLAKAYRAADDGAAACKYDGLFGQIRDAFDHANVAPDGCIRGFELLPASLRPRAVEHLADDMAAHGNQLTTGFVGFTFPARECGNGPGKRTGRWAACFPGSSARSLNAYNTVEEFVRRNDLSAGG